MSEKTYRVERFVPDEQMDENEFCVPVYHEPRYRIVDAETGAVLDDANGYGYRTVQKAHAGWSYKSRTKADRKAAAAHVRNVKAWIKAQPGLDATLEDVAFQIAKGTGGPDEKFGAKIVSEALDALNITDRPYSSAEIARCWLK